MTQVSQYYLPTLWKEPRREMYSSFGNTIAYGTVRRIVCDATRQLWAG